MAFQKHCDEHLKQGKENFCEDNAKMDTSDNNDTVKENEDKQKEYKIQCDEINKRSIGKAIVKFCGNEGTVNDKNTTMLRRLLQAAVSHIEHEPSHTWKNAEVKLYDDNFDMYSIRAGAGNRVFMVSLDENDEPKVIRTKQSRVNTKAVEGRGCLLM